MVNAICSYKVYKSEKHESKYVYSSLGVVLNLFILALFKYGGFIESQFRYIMDYGSAADLILVLPLPIGISFYTFQGISLVLDVRNNKNTLIAQSFYEHMKKTALFISFFPQLIAGPILRPSQFYSQIKAKAISKISWRHVFRYLILGYFLLTITCR